MATHRIPILNWHFIPDASGNVFVEPYDVKATNDVFKLLILVFNDTSTKLVVYGGFTVPKNFVGTAKIVVKWTSTATSGNTVWDFDYRAIGGDDAESYDQATFQESVTVTDAAPGAANRQLEVSVNLTSSNLAVDDFVEFQFGRDGADGSDTMAAAAMLFDVYFEYADA